LKSGGVLVLLNRRKRSFVLVAAQTTVLLLLTTIPLLAQQASSSPVTQQTVPDNLMHPSGAVQPIPYSHKSHLALGLTCQFCHTNPEPGKLMTYPAISICMSCHTSIAKRKPAIQKLATFAKSHQTIPWVRVYAVLPGVTWTHRPHLEAGMKCEMCHGQVAQMEVMAEATSVTTMYVCLTCHQQNHAKATCNTCHLWP
jgi:Cytochrome c7 and related cytochrome c